MTSEQKEERKRSAISGKIKELKDHCICTKDDGRDFVFISYKSDSWKTVFEDILYEVCYKYGLQIYVDTNFDDNAETWLKQFQKNMNHPCCKAVIAFTDDAYYSSYATLMEMMARRTKQAGGMHFANKHPFLPIEIGKKRGDLSGAELGKNTGLGTKRFGDGSENELAREELIDFNKLFKKIIQEKELEELADTYEKDKYDIPDDEIEAHLYYEKTKGDPEINNQFLNVGDCRYIMDKVMPKMNVNDGGNKSFVEVIHDKLVNMGLKCVFDESRAHWKRTAPQLSEPRRLESPVTVAVSDSAEKATMSLPEFRKRYKDNFKKSMFRKIRLTGKGGYAAYSMGDYESTADLVWDFMKRLLEERGELYIQQVNEKHSLANPPFITVEEHARRKAAGKSVSYKKLETPGLTGYSMYTNYNQYEWLGDALVNRMKDAGLPPEQFEIEIDPTESGQTPSAAETLDLIGQTPSAAETPDLIGQTPAATVSDSAEKATMSLPEFRKRYKDNFKKSMFRKIRLTGKGGCAAYSMGDYESTADLVWDFMKRLLEERGEPYIRQANEKHPLANPPFITVEEHERRKAAGKSVSYKRLETPGLTGYSMYNNYNQYEWLGDALVNRMKDAGLSPEQFEIEIDLTESGEAAEASVREHADEAAGSASAGGETEDNGITGEAHLF